MIKKSITYTDYNGVERTEDHYFNLSEGEVTEMEMTTSGGYAEMLTRIVAAQDAPSLFRTFKEFILKSYGVKSPDGRRFEKKNGELAAAFVETEAYSVLIRELCTNTQSAIEFVNGVLPNKTSKSAAVVNNVTN